MAPVRSGVGRFHGERSMSATGSENARALDGIGFRPITDADLPFLRRLYASTREQEVAQIPHWTQEQKSQFLAMQFEAQHRYYQEQFTRADFLVIERDGEAIGRLYVDRRADEIRLIDIALLPGQRNRGVGRALTENLLAEAADSGLPVRIHVEKENPAMRLYRRLGFEPIEDRGVYQLMQWSPASGVAQR